uniref:Uncharacterized protein n=1 Tax=Plectus sambesii TaxID=2011161 RepID=A0A914X2F0_9BILA
MTTLVVGDRLYSIEATGLLMKECDKLRGRPNPAHDRRQSEALQQRPTSSSSTDDPADFACESSTTVVKNLSYRRPSEPHSVARAILRVVRSRFVLTAM